MGVINNIASNSQTGSNTAFDNRIVQVGIQFQDKTLTFEGLSIYASGRIFGSAQQNQCEVRIYNLTAEQRNYILTQATPYKIPRTPVQISLNVGRQSYGAFLLYIGNAITCGVTQPPDIGITLHALTNNFLNGFILGSGQSSLSTLYNIAVSVAAANNLTLQWYASDRQIDNWSPNGAAIKQIDELNQIGGIIASNVNNNLIVVNAGQSAPGEPIEVNASTGMVGIPQVTEIGVNVRVMITNQYQLFREIKVTSTTNPGANGTYIIIGMGFEVASRDTPFWYILECKTIQYNLGTQG